MIESAKLGKEGCNGSFVRDDPTQDGADVAFAVMDRVRTELLHRVGLSELLESLASARKRDG